MTLELKKSTQRKGILFILAIMLGVFVNCEREKGVRKVRKEQAIGKEEILNNQKPTAWIAFRLRRGKKWSQAHGVPSCTRGFGFCIIDGGVSPYPLPFKQTGLSDEHYPVRFEFARLQKGQNKGKIIFGEQVPHAEPVFWGREEDTLFFPDFIADMYGVGKLALLPGDYVFETSDENPEGFIMANFYVE